MYICRHGAPAQALRQPVRPENVTIPSSSDGCEDRVSADRRFHPAAVQAGIFLRPCIADLSPTALDYAGRLPPGAFRQAGRSCGRRRPHTVSGRPRSSDIESDPCCEHAWLPGAVAPLHPMSPHHVCWAGEAESI